MKIVEPWSSNMHTGLLSARGQTDPARYLVVRHDPRIVAGYVSGHSLLCERHSRKPFADWQAWCVVAICDLVPVPNTEPVESRT